MTVEWTGVRDSDLDAWVEALALIEAFDRTGEVLGRGDLEEQCALSYFDPGVDARIGRLDGRLVAWGTVLCIPSPHQRRVMLDGAVVPGWRDRGIGRELLAWQIDRGRAVAARGPADAPGWLEVSASEGDLPRERIFEALGFTRMRYYLEMRRNLATFEPGGRSLPGGVRIEPYDEHRDEQVRAAHNEAFVDHFASYRLDAETWAALVTGPGFRPDCSLLALAGEEIIGYSINGVHPDDWPSLGFTEGWTHQLGVRRPWRGRGVATALLDATATVFAAEGLDYAALDVDADNPTGALGLYEANGYRRDKTRVSWSRSVG